MNGQKHVTSVVEETLKAKKKIKLYLSQAVDAHWVVRCQGSNIF
jgi:hypothetical protein